MSAPSPTAPRGVGSSPTTPSTQKAAQKSSTKKPKGAWDHGQCGCSGMPGEGVLRMMVCKQPRMMAAGALAKRLHCNELLRCHASCLMPLRHASATPPPQLCALSSCYGVPSNSSSLWDTRAPKNEWEVTLEVSKLKSRVSVVLMDPLSYAGARSSHSPTFLQPRSPTLQLV